MSIPERTTDREDQALQALASYEPGILDRVLGRAESKQTRLELAVQEARRADDAAHDRAVREAHQRHDQAVAEYEADAAAIDRDVALAERVLAGDLEAIRDALTSLNPFSEIGDLGTEVAFGFTRADDRGLDDVLLSISVQVHGQDILPKERLSLLQSGKLSRRQMSASMYNEIHQDYVAGCVLRVASETLALLPVDHVIVTATDQMLNPSTGHIEETALLSAYTPRTTMDRLNLAGADASDALANFMHRMSFKKTKGFDRVEPLKRSDIPGLGELG
ncbi:hypothetical protein B1759_15065 [Rubrivirga sp. SAORIC476]|nr:hypothetical protein B1759_15065 [Rubrivirga sp. SAORIC476]